MWREIATRYAKSKVKLSAKEPNITGWELTKNWYAVGLSTKDPDKFQGYHADSGYLLVVVDEAAGIDEALFEAIDAILTSDRCRLLMIGNPTSNSGTFRDSHKPSYPASKIKISAFDTPNFTANNIRNEDDLINAIETKQKLIEKAPYLCSPIWVYERIKKWGIGSPMYQSRVRGEFPAEGENTLIPLTWIEAATSDERLDKLLGLDLPSPEGLSPSKMSDVERSNKAKRCEALAQYKQSQEFVQGVDVARFGNDSTVIQPRFGWSVPHAKQYYKTDTMATAGNVWSNLRNKPTEMVNIDVIGLGAGTVDRLHELQQEQNAIDNHQWTRIHGVNVALPSDKTPENTQMGYANLRAELYWTLRGLFERGEIYLEPNEYGHPDEDLMSELSSIEYKFIGGKIYVEEKHEMKKRLHGKSPDKADALMLTLANVYSSWTTNKVEETMSQADRIDQKIERSIEPAKAYKSTGGTVMSGLDGRY